METFGAAVDGEDDVFLDQQPDQGDDDFMSDDDDFPHEQPGQGEEEEEDYFMSDDDDDHDYRSAQGDNDDDEFMSVSDDEEYHHPFPVLAPLAAASEAAIAALEAAEAPADDCCPVCLQDGEAPVRVRVPVVWPWSRVAPCGHRFHAACVEKWLRVKLTCPVCRCPCPAAVPPAPPAAARRRDAAPEPPRPIPDIVEEFLAVGYEESLVFDKSPRWMEFTDDAYGHLTSNSSRVS